jgi:hypothetical protein
MDAIDNCLLPDQHLDTTREDATVYNRNDNSDGHKSSQEQPSLLPHTQQAPATSGAPDSGGLGARALAMIAEAVSIATVQALAPLLPKATPAVRNDNTEEATSSGSTTRSPAQHQEATTNLVGTGVSGSHVTLNSAAGAEGHLTQASGSGVGLPNTSNPNLFGEKGVPASSLPNLHIVAPELKRDVLAGKHINLCKLLVPNYKETAPREMQLGESTISLKPLADARLDKPLPIHEFVVAFTIYMDIVTEAFPSRRAELNTYLADIIKMANRYPGLRFYDYHNAFSQKAAQYLTERGVKIDWSCRDQSLFVEYFSGLTPNSCAVCNSIGHATRFCPQQASERARNYTPDQTSDRNRNSTTRGGTSHTANRPFKRPATTNIDIQGRPVLWQEGKPVCNNFNTERGCLFRKCDRLHVCCNCRQAHSVIQCSSKN